MVGDGEYEGEREYECERDFRLVFVDGVVEWEPECVEWECFECLDRDWECRWCLDRDRECSWCLDREWSECLADWVDLADLADVVDQSF